MTEICPTGPPKLMKPSFSQNQNASLNDIVGALASADESTCEDGGDAIKAAPYGRTPAEQALDADASW
jgi:hypothetical protein